MYVDILFPLTKAIPVMFERIIIHHQTLNTWIGHSAMCYHTHYQTFSLSLVWLWGYLQRATTRYHLILKNIKKKKIDGNAKMIDDNAWKHVTNSPKTGKFQRKI